MHHLGLADNNSSTVLNFLNGYFLAALAARRAARTKAGSITNETGAWGRQLRREAYSRSPAATAPRLLQFDRRTSIA